MPIEQSPAISDEEIEREFDDSIVYLTPEEMDEHMFSLGIMTQQKDELVSKINGGILFKLALLGVTEQAAIAKRFILRGARNVLESTIERSRSDTWAKIAASIFKLGAVKGFWPRINPKKLPNLLDDKYGDYELKTEFQAAIANKTLSSLDLASEMAVFVKRAFHLGIPAQTLLEFFSDENIMVMLLEVIINIDINQESFTERLAADIDRDFRLDVDEEVEVEVKKYVEHFRVNYDPNDMSKTLTHFTRALVAAFPGHDILGWLSKNLELIREIILGGVTAKNRCEEEYDPEKPAKTAVNHLGKIINKAYEQIGAFNIQEFIDMNLGIFFETNTFEKANPGDLPTFMKKPLIEAGIQDGDDYLILDISALHEFFNDTLSHFDAQEGLIEIRGLIIDTCIGLAIEMNPKMILIAKQTTDGSLLREYEVIKHEDSKDIFTEIVEQVENAVQIMPSHTDVENLLADPLMIPREFKELRDRWFNDEGELIDSDSYDQFLRSLFAQSTKTGERREGIHIVKERISLMLAEVNDYLGSISEDLAVPSTMTSDDVRNTNDYAELVLISTDKKRSHIERFEARRKLELVTLLYSCKRTPRMVFQENEKKEVKRVLEMQRDGVNILPGVVGILHFRDTPDGRAEVIEDVEDIAEDDPEIKRVPLIKTNFGKTKCYLLPANSDPESAKKDQEYVGKKSLFSMLTKLLKSEKKRANTITDLLRMTFVVDDESDLKQIQDHLEMNHISFGRVLKKEDKYSDSFEYKTTVNQHTSNEYKTLRYVVDVPIRSMDRDKKHNYLVPIEIRVLTKSDLAKERSEHNNASHKQYEKRRLTEVYKKIAPKGIYPERYKTVEPSSYAILEAVNDDVVKTKEDYEAAA
jgi:hypothetical protein